MSKDKSIYHAPITNLKQYTSHQQPLLQETKVTEKYNQLRQNVTS